MFQLSAKEFANLKSQFVISSWGGSRHAAPYTFTEHGVAMLENLATHEDRIAVSSAPTFTGGLAKGFEHDK